MKKFKVLFLAMLALFLVAGTSMAVPLGTTLDDVFDFIAVDGDNDVYVYNDYIADSSDSYWGMTATGVGGASLIIELAGYSGSTTFGLYDMGDHENTVEIFTGSNSTGTKASIDIDAVGNVTVGNSTNGTWSYGTFSGTNFGYYLDVVETGRTYYSDTLLNDDGFDHMLSYKGVGESVDLDGDEDDFSVGTWTSAEYMLAWEDLYEGGDEDYADMVVMVESVEPIPEPATMLLLGVGLLGLAGVSRRRS